MSQAQDPRSNPARVLAPLAAFGLVAAAIGVGFFLGFGRGNPSKGAVDDAALALDTSALSEAAQAPGADMAVDSGSSASAPLMAADTAAMDQAAHAPQAAAQTVAESASDLLEAAAPAEPAVQIAAEDLYLPTGAATDAEGLQAAEAGRIGKPTLVFFHADWCHVCQEIAPDVAALQSDYAEQVAFVKMNIDHAESSEATQRYQVAATPTFVLIGSSGEQLEYFRGWPGEGRLAQAFDAAAMRQ